MLRLSSLVEVHLQGVDFSVHFPLLAGHTQTANLAIRQVMEYRWKQGFDSPALHVEDNYSGNQELSIFAFYDEKRRRLPGTLDC